MKIALNDLANLQNENTAVSTINTNNETLEVAFDNTLSRDGTAPNQMESSLDMNSFRIINLPLPVGLTEPLRVQDANTLNGGGTINVSTLPAGGIATDVLAKTDSTDFLTQWDHSTGTGDVVRATSPALVTPTGIVKNDVGLGNVDNTSDATKNSASATLTNKTFDTASNTFKLNGAAFGTPAEALTALGISQETLPWINVKDYGAKGDGIVVGGTVTVTSGSPNLTVSGGIFTAADVGKNIQIPGAGSGATVLVTTILTYTSPTQVVLATNAISSVSTNKSVFYYTDDTTAISSAVAASGLTGTIIFPKGIYAYSTLVFDGAIGLHLLGEGALGASILRCISNTSTGGCKFRSTFDVTTSFITFDHSSTGFTGYLVDASHQPSSAIDTQGLYFFRCAFASQGYNLYSANGCSLNQADLVTFEGCKFGSLVRPIDGQSSGGGSYSNGIRFKNCQAADNIGFFANSLGTGWTFQDCNFQACHDGAQRIAYTSSSVTWQNLVFINCGIYDGTVGGTSYLTLDKGFGLTIQNGLWGGIATSNLLAATGIIKGVCIQGVYASLFSYVLYANVTGNVGWNYDGGNCFASCTNVIGNSANISGLSGTTTNAVF